MNVKSIKLTVAVEVEDDDTDTLRYIEELRSEVEEGLLYHDGDSFCDISVTDLVDFGKPHDS